MKDDIVIGDNVEYAYSLGKCVLGHGIAKGQVIDLYTLDNINFATVKLSNGNETKVGLYSLKKLNKNNN